jgi:hypothetical protein
LPSQPKNAQAHNRPRVTITADRTFSVDAAATVKALWEQLGVNPGSALADLYATPPNGVWYLDRPVPRGHALEIGSITPNAQRPRDLGCAALAEAASAAGCLTIPMRIWSDERRQNYASAPRVIEVLRVAQPWTFTRIDPKQNSTGGLYTRGEVPAGDYLVATIGGPEETQACIAGRIENLPATGDLAAVEAFAAQTVTGTCSRCSRAWTAFDGQTVLSPTHASGPTWLLSDAADLGRVTSTVACPTEGCTGRISFVIGGGA